MKLSELLNPAAKYAESLQKYLDKLPVDEVFSGLQLTNKMGTTRHAFRGAAACLPTKYICRRNGVLAFYGHPKAIAALREGWGLK